MIHVTAMIELKEGCRDAFLHEFHKIVPIVKAEDGCIDYKPTIDVDTGVDRIEFPRADVVTVIETWESLETLRAHLSNPDLAAYKAKVKDFVMGARIYVTEPAQEENAE